MYIDSCNKAVKRGAIEKIEVFLDQENICVNIVKLNYKGDYSDYIGLYDLYSIEESIASMQNSYSSDDEIHDMEYAIIGECTDNNSILLGLGEKNRDQIFLECTSIFPSGERIVKISDNIFSFINGLSLCEKAKVGYGIKSYSELYKNWNEPFWRVGEKR